MPTRFIQAIQLIIQRRLIGPTLRGARVPGAPWPVKLLDRFPILRRIPARVIGLGSVLRARRDARCPSKLTRRPTRGLAKPPRLLYPNRHGPFAKSKVGACDRGRRDGRPGRRRPADLAGRQHSRSPARPEAAARRLPTAPAPNYAKAAAWAHLPTDSTPESRPVDVFFVHPTTFDGGTNWNGPIGDRRSAALLERVMLPNYAAPFAGLGRVFAPRYRQASLYTSLTLFDDAIEAREFAYGDVRAAFDYFRDRLSRGRPFILVGVEQGAGGLAPPACCARRSPPIQP